MISTNDNRPSQRRGLAHTFGWMRCNAKTTRANYVWEKPDGTFVVVPYPHEPTVIQTRYLRGTQTQR